MASFSEVVEAANKLSTDEQETLLEILGHRLVERKRAELARDIEKAQAVRSAGTAGSQCVR
ncbi:MAG: hypothetical protein U0805_16945 [Pirellulales bacterium]